MPMLQKSHKTQNNLLPYSPMNLKCYYTFLITDVPLNAWEENPIDIHIYAYFGGDGYKHVGILFRRYEIEYRQIKYYHFPQIQIRKKRCFQGMQIYLLEHKYPLQSSYVQYFTTKRHFLNLSHHENKQAKNWQNVNLSHLIT